MSRHNLIAHDANGLPFEVSTCGTDPFEGTVSIVDRHGNVFYFRQAFEEGGRTLYAWEDIADGETVVTQVRP